MRSTPPRSPQAHRAAWRAPATIAPSTFQLRCRGSRRSLRACTPRRRASRTPCDSHQRDRRSPGPIVASGPVQLPGRRRRSPRPRPDPFPAGGSASPCAARSTRPMWRWRAATWRASPRPEMRDRKSTRLNSSHVRISYAVFCLKKKIIRQHDLLVLRLFGLLLLLLLLLVVLQALALVQPVCLLGLLLDTVVDVSGVSSSNLRC